ncbi:DUF1674 domain-containing protein [Alkalilacustris brevis]|uniref:DUF1674 domain-containing protein n=1 Tax=Alkalilacustris brevis TaxID=2026338 RepID=UPI00192E372E|nr:DUF1674 domain-containing protein [Alkalilacustris brevis]
MQDTPDSPDRPREAPQTSDFSTLPPAARRALAEAEERRRKADAQKMPRELGGRDGPEPVRFGDWERKGIAVDF